MGFTIIYILIFLLLFVNEGLSNEGSNPTINILLHSNLNSLDIENEKTFIFDRLTSLLKYDDVEKFTFNIEFKNSNQYYADVDEYIKKDNSGEDRFYDIYMLEDRLVDEYKGYLHTLEGLDKRIHGSLKSVLDDCVIGDKKEIKCLPYTVDFGLLYYRQMNLNYSSIPDFKYLQDYIKLAKGNIIKNNSTKKEEEVYGFGGQFAIEENERNKDKKKRDNQSLLYNFLEWAYYYGNGNIMNYNLENTLEKIKEFRKDGLISDDLFGKSNDEIFQLFIDDYLAIYRGWFSTFQSINRIFGNSNVNNTLSKIFTFTTFPSSMSNRHSSTYIKYYLAISEKSKYKNTSKRIIQYLCSPEFQKEYSQIFFHIPPIRSLRLNLTYPNIDNEDVRKTFEYIERCKVTTDLIYKNENKTQTKLTDMSPLQWTSVAERMSRTLRKFFNKTVTDIDDKYIIQTVMALHNDIGDIYDDHVNKLAFKIENIRYPLGLPVTIITTEVIVLCILLLLLLIKCIKHNPKKIITYHTPFYYVSCILSIILSIVGYIFIFDPPFENRNKCSYRMWFFDLSLNIMFLAFIKKFYVIVNQLRSQFTYYNYKSNTLLIIYCMFIFEVFVKILITIVNPNEAGVGFLIYKSRLSYYTCGLDLNKNGLIFIVVLFQILVRSIVMTVITYLYLFVRKTNAEYYPVKFMIIITFCSFFLICLFYVYVGYKFYIQPFYILLYAFYIYILIKLFLSNNDIIVIHNFEKVNNDYYMNANMDADNGSNYSGSDLDESDELLSIDSSSSSTSCFSEYISPIMSEKDIISTYISLPYLSPFAENNVYIPCCVSFMVDSKVLIIEPIIKNKVVALINNSIRSENITLLNYDAQKEYQEDDVIFYTQKDFRYIFSINNFVIIINNDLNDNRMIQLNEKMDDEYEFGETNNGIFNVLNKDHNSNNSLPDANNALAYDRPNSYINPYEKRKSDSNSKLETIPTIIRFNINSNSVKYKKWYNLLINHTKTRVTDKIDIPINIHKEFYSNEANNLYGNNQRQLINRDKKVDNKESELDLVHTDNSFENESDENFTPFGYHYDINVASNYDPFVKNYSPFNYSRYQPIQISLDEDNKGQRINYNGEREDVPMATLMNNESTLVPVESISRSSNVTPSIMTSNTNNNLDTISDDLTINTNYPRLNNRFNLHIRSGGGDGIRKEYKKNLNKFLGQDSPMSHLTYSNISTQAEINSLNMESDTPISNNDISFNSSNDIMDPLIVPHNNNNDNYYSKKPSNNLTHRRKMVKSSSNSYLFKSDSNDELSEEQINLLNKKSSS